MFNFTKKRAQELEQEKKALAEKHTEIDIIRAQLYVEKEALEKQLKDMEKKQKALSDRENNISLRELEYNDKRNNAENNFIEEKNKVYNEKYKEHMDKLENLYKERINKETNFHNKLEELYENKVEEYSANFIKEHEKLTKALIEEKIKFEESIKAIKEEIDKKEQYIVTQNGRLNDWQNNLQGKEKCLIEKEENIENKVAELIQEERDFFEKEKERLKSDITDLRQEVLHYKEYKIYIDEFQNQYDEDLPALLQEKDRLISEINEKEENINDIENEWREKYETLKYNYDELKEKLVETRVERDEARDKGKINEYNQLLAENKTLKDENESLARHNQFLEKENVRLTLSYKDGTARDERVAELLKPYIQYEDIRKDKFEEELKEVEYLDEIHTKMYGHGFVFSKRLLYSFHTSLKTAEWSPLTVLSGVSGTGKSELPKLYSHFGGFNFMPVSVQPNWDSQEAMLGFFNSLDNKFDAQPLLKFLVQTQDEGNEARASLKDYMNIVLLDEMNLAHIELYFAEFLSKLELRRGEKTNIPYLPIKLGIGMEEYPLKLGKNVLWVGTINQDETTKTLSDKVIDRGMIINFPRPKTLVSRKELKPLDKQEKLLNKKTWEKWCKFEIDKSGVDNKKIEPYKEKIEKINEEFSKMGKAMGNRVWQSIEYYMNNYPVQDNKLDDALNLAFEDQLVLKVMPKLQGVECRGNNKHYLENIKKELGENLQDDFNNAINNNDGYFYWNSSSYLNEDSGDKGNTNSDEKKEK